MTERTATITGREDTEALRNLFEFVNGIRGVDFALYRQATVTRKLGLRLEETRTYNCREYLSYLKAHPEELDNLIRALTIKVSNFFRNPLVFELLEAFILPELIAQFRSLSVWSLGCANGEEPYSIAMLAHELLKREKERFDVNILGMDICEGAVDNAVRGEYPAGELLEVKKKYMDAFFDRVLRPGGHPHEHESLYRITDTIKEMVKFECGDIAGNSRQYPGHIEDGRVSDNRRIRDCPRDLPEGFRPDLSGSQNIQETKGLTPGSLPPAHLIRLSGDRKLTDPF